MAKLRDAVKCNWMEIVQDKLYFAIFNQHLNISFIMIKFANIFFKKF